MKPTTTILRAALISTVAAAASWAEELEISATAVTNPAALVLRVQGYNNTTPLIVYRRPATGSYSSWTEVLTTNLPAPAGIGTS